MMEEVTDPQQLAEARARRARFDRNEAWLQTHVAEIYRCHRGKYVCIAGEELFVADTPQEIDRLVSEKYPDELAHVRYVQREKRDRIYACQR